MTIARRDIAPEGEEGTFHCTARCVRQAWLCGQDEHSGRDYEHRKAWIRERLIFLVSLFAVEVIGYAILSNHWHTLLRTLPKLAREWAAEEVVRRWLLLFPSRRMRRTGEAVPSVDDIERVLRQPGRVEVLRERLSSLSWFMRCVDEHIARRANREDGCKGRFWEGRFKSRALLDEAAILTALTYVDLNPVRAGLATTPEESVYTSAWERIMDLQEEVLAGRLTETGTVLFRPEGLEEGGIPESLAMEQSGTREPDQPENVKVTGVFSVKAMESEAHVQPANASSALAENDVKAFTGSSDRMLRGGLSGWLSPFTDTSEQRGVFRRMTLTEYLRVLDEVGRVIRLDKPSSIPAGLAPILERLEIQVDQWVGAVQGYEEGFRRMIGRPDAVRAAAERAGRCWFQGMTACSALYRDDKRKTNDPLLPA